MEDIGNGLMASYISDTRASGKREEYESTTVYVQWREHSGSVELKDGEWPEDGIEWDVCPSEWESLESDVQDWVEKEVLV
jgi:hypothetical protein